MRTFLALTILTLLTTTCLASEEARDLPFEVQSDQTRELLDWEVEALLTYQKQEGLEIKIASVDLTQEQVHVRMTNNEQCRVDFYNILSRVLYKDVILMDKAMEKTIPLFDLDCGQSELTFTRREHYVQKLNELGNNMIEHALTTHQLQ